MAKDNHEWLKAAFDEHSRMVFNVCMRITRNAAMAEDATQATFMLFHQKQKNLKPGPHLAGWLYRAADLISRKAVRTEMRRKNREKKYAREAEEKAMGSSAADWQAISTQIDQAMTALPDRLSLPLILVYLQGMKREEAARKLNIPERTLYDRLSKGLKRLRKHLGSSSSISMPVLTALITNNSLQYTIPTTVFPALTGAVKAASVAGVATHSTTIYLMEQAMKTLFWSKVKIGTVLIGSVLLTATVTAPLARNWEPSNATPQNKAPSLQNREKRLTDQLNRLKEENQVLKAASTDNQKAVAELTSQNQRLNNEVALLQQAVALQKERPATHVEKPEKTDKTAEQLINAVDWDDTAAAIVKNYKKTNGFTAEMLLTLMKYMGPILKLQQHFEIQDIQSLFFHEQVIEKLLPGYVFHTTKKEITETQMAEIHDLTRMVSDKRDTNILSDFPGFSYLLMEAEYKNSMIAILGKETFTDLQHNLHLLGPLPISIKNRIHGGEYFSNYQQSDDVSDWIAKAWTKEFKLKKTDYDLIRPIAEELGQHVIKSSIPRRQYRHYLPVSTELINAHMDASRQLTNALSLEPDQVKRIKHSGMLFRIRY